MKLLTAIFVCATFGALASAKDLEPGSSVRGRVEAVTKDGVVLANAVLTEPVVKKWDAGAITNGFLAGLGRRRGGIVMALIDGVGRLQRVAVHLDRLNIEVAIGGVGARKPAGQDNRVDPDRGRPAAAPTGDRFSSHAARATG